MPVFTHTSTFPVGKDALYTWLTRPGALTRATPHWAGAVKQEGDPLTVGSSANLRMAVPYTSGLLSLPWRAEHTQAGESGFTDVMRRGAVRRWEHRHDLLETPNETVMRETIDYELVPGRVGDVRLLTGQVERHLQRVFDARARRVAADLEFWGRYPGEPLTVVVAGASGLVGRQVVALLGGGGHTVRTLVRREPTAPGEFRWDPSRGQIDDAVFEGADAVIHLGGASINQPFIAKNKRAILESRLDSTRLLAGKLAELAQADRGPRVFVCASAVGFYGADRGTEVLYEDAGAGSGFLADVCARWEAACAPAREAGVRTVNVRTGLVQSALGGMLRLQLPLFLTGTGGYVGDGSQVQSWVSLDDIAGVYVHALLTDSVEGPVNAVAPHPVTAKELARTVGKVLRRPAVLPIPAAAPALLLRPEGVRELALASQNASADKLLASGYVFFEPDLHRALEHELVR